jgi:hypothetical protein
MLVSSLKLRPSRMIKPPSFLRILTEPGPLGVLCVTIALLVGIVGPASAQFFNFGPFGQRPAAPRGGGSGGFFGDFFSPYQQQQPKRVYQDFSKAPLPEKRDSVPERNVLVMGDGMADWLAYGLEDAYVEQPDMGVVRKAKNTSGLIKYQPKGEPADWAAAARGILTTEKPDVVVIMLGLNDRIAMREPAADKGDKDKSADKKKDAGGKPAESKPAADNKAEEKAKPESKSEEKSDAKSSDAKSDDKAADAELDDSDNVEAPAPPTREKTARSPNGLYEFRDDRWVELYSKKIEEMIAAAKSKGVPVIWVGLPAIRGAKGSSDMLFLDSLYREATGKAGITYVDVWDGFVDERGLMMQKGPDFEGQIRQLRSYDGVYFTKYGARKLAHYVEREISRVLATRSSPVALPTEPATPDANAVPGQPAPRPLAGPIVPLVAASVNSDQLLGGPGTRPAAVDALAARTLVKGEALNPPAGRADDFAWPHREVGREQAKGDVPVANATPAERGTNPGAPGTPGVPNSALAPSKSQQPAAKKPPPPQAGPSQASPFGNFFSLGNGNPAAPPPPRQMAPPPRQMTPGVPRPPAAVGRSAAVAQ